MPDAEQALIVAAYKFAGVLDPERLAAAFLAQSGGDPTPRAVPEPRPAGSAAAGRRPSLGTFRIPRFLRPAFILCGS